MLIVPNLLRAMGLAALLAAGALAACQDLTYESRARADADIILEGMRRAHDPSRWPTAESPGPQ